MDNAIFTGDWADIIRLLPGFGRNAGLVFEYIELHNIFPLKKKSKKILRLLKDMAGLFEREKFKNLQP